MNSWSAAQDKDANPMLAGFLRDAERNARSMEKAHIDALKAASAARYVDLGEKTLKVIDEAIPKAYRKYQELLKGEKGILKSEAGRFHSQDQETVEIIMRYSAEDVLPGSTSSEKELDNIRIDFGENERVQRAKIVTEAIENLEADTGATFSAESAFVKVIERNASWASRAWEMITQRNTLLEGYLAVKLDGVDLSSFPTMEEEISATIHRRMVTMGKALNEVERAAAEEKVKRLAEATKDVEANKLKDQIDALRTLAEEQRGLDAAKAQGEQEAIRIESEKLLQDQREKFETELADVRERQAILEKELAARDLELEKIAKEEEGMRKTKELSEKKRALPQNAKVLISALSAKGYYKPTAIYTSGGRPMIDFSSRYPGLEPQPHSLSVLAASGALEDTAKGVMTMYCILSVDRDKERPRIQQPIRLSSNTATSPILALPKDMSAALTASETTKELMKKIRTIQELVRKYGEQLVEEGLLKP
ncbi:MAG: hypothetical protein AB8D78_01620 [Akkermansiaceae bacterium]